jgi:hypothetical protein
MAWVSNGGEFVVAPKRFMPLTTLSSTNTTSTVIGNDVFGQVLLVVTGTIASGAIVASVVPPIPLPPAAYVYVSPAESKAATGGNSMTNGTTNAWFASVSTAGNIAIGSVGGTAGLSTASSLTINYFVAQ